MSEDTEVQELDENTQEEVVAEVAPVVAEAAKEPVKEERPVYSMPVAKAQEEKQRAVEKAREEARAEAEIERRKLQESYEAKLAAVVPQDDYATELKSVSEEYGLDPAAASKLLSVMEKKLKNGLPDMSKYDTILKDREIEGLKSQVSQEFEEKVAPLILKDYPQATPEHIREVKERIAELAFTKGYNTYQLEDIYKVKRDEFEFKNGFSAESSGGRTSELVDFSKVTDEEELAMAKNSPETFKKFLKWQEAHTSKYLD